MFSKFVHVLECSTAFLFGRPWFLNFIHPLTDGQGCLEKWLILEQGQGKNKMIWEHLVGQKKQGNAHRMVEMCQKDTKASLKGLPMANLESKINYSKRIMAY